MIEGVLLLNKPAEMTSFDVIRRLKPLLPRRTKIGHAGTLDPFATGLLIISIGRGATKHLGRFMGLPKRYQATGKLNQVTTTLDYTGVDLETEEYALPSQESLNEAIATLGDCYIQTPPAYSALKHKGTPLYKLARKNKMSEGELTAIATQKQREVTLYQCNLTKYEAPFFSIDTTVSQGTYIRTLTHDIALQAGASGATTHVLNRSHIGPFAAKTAATIDDITAEKLESLVMPVEQVLAQIE